MKRKILIPTLVLVIVAALTAIVFATTGAGSESDPLVSQSYVDARTTYQAVSIDEGQSLIGKAGTEIILRSGEATAIDNGANGVSDVTAGTDLRSGTEVELNHLLLTPRDDGRGIYAKTVIWVMVRGDYTVE